MMVPFTSTVEVSWTRREAVAWNGESQSISSILSMLRMEFQAPREVAKQALGHMCLELMRTVLSGLEIRKIRT